MSNTMQWVKAEGGMKMIISPLTEFQVTSILRLIDSLELSSRIKIVAAESESGGGMAEALEEIAKGQQGELKGDFIARVTKLAKAALGGK